MCDDSGWSLDQRISVLLHERRGHIRPASPVMATGHHETTGAKMHCYAFLGMLEDLLAPLERSEAGIDRRILCRWWWRRPTGPWREWDQIGWLVFPKTWQDRRRSVSQLVHFPGG